MMRTLREPMTISQLKRSMDKRLDRLQRLQRTKADKRDLAALGVEVRRSAKETRRHFDVVAESLRDDLRIFADAIGRDSERLDNHEIRPVRLEDRL